MSDPPSSDTQSSPPLSLSDLPSPVLKAIASALVHPLGPTTRFVDRDTKTLSRLARTCKAIRAEVEPSLWQTVQADAKYKLKDVLRKGCEAFRYTRSLCVVLDEIDSLLPSTWRLLHSHCPRLESLEIWRSTIPNATIDEHLAAAAMEAPADLTFFGIHSPIPNIPDIVFSELKRLRVIILDEPDGECVPPILDLFHSGVPEGTINESFPSLEQLSLTCPPEGMVLIGECCGCFPTVKKADIRVIGTANSTCFQAAAVLLPNVEVLEAGGAGPSEHRAEVCPDPECIASFNTIHWTPLRSCRSLKALTVTLAQTYFKDPTFSSDCLTKIPPSYDDPTVDPRDISLHIHLDGSPVSPETAVEATRYLAVAITNLERVDIVASLHGDFFGLCPAEIWGTEVKEANRLGLEIKRKSDGRIKIKGTSWWHDGRGRAGLQPLVPLIPGPLL